MPGINTRRAIGKVSRRLRLNRRGGTTVALATGATALLGMAALATEGGVWYMSRRNAQSAADTAVYAAVAQVAFHGTGDAGVVAAGTVGRQVAALNGFADDDRTDITISLCRWEAGGCTTDPGAGEPNAVQVEIEQLQSLGLARLISTDQPTVRVNAIASLRDSGPACTLTLTGSTKISGSNNTQATNCILASNRLGPTSFEFQGNATLEAYSARAMGNCNGCEAATLEVAFTEFANIPLDDPYKRLQETDLPAFSGSQCQNQISQNNANWTDPVTGQTSKVTLWRPQPWNQGGTQTGICTDIKINNGDVLELVPGTYFFYGADLRVNGGRVLCPSCEVGGAGVTLVFTGDHTKKNNGVGTVHITGGTVDLSAPSEGPWNDPKYRGILFYRDYRANADNTKNPDNASNPNTAIFVGNPSIFLAGGFYFPSTLVQFGGNSSTGQLADNCTAIVAQTLELTGNSTLNILGCERLGTEVPRDRYVQIVQ